MKVNITKLSLCAQRNTKHLAGIKSQERVGQLESFTFNLCSTAYLPSTIQCPYLQNGGMVVLVV